ncbi:MAG: GxxExxY protein [Syntrophales bacterium]|nr:GxxExxY protein [Syntrophales bacterium]
MSFNLFPLSALSLELQIHKGLGPGLLESVYEVVLAHALKSRGLKVDRQVPVAISLSSHQIGIVYQDSMRITNPLFNLRKSA